MAGTELEQLLAAIGTLTQRVEDLHEAMAGTLKDRGLVQRVVALEVWQSAGTSWGRDVLKMVISAVVGAMVAMAVAGTTLHAIPEHK